ncbi:precorrin-2 dehydrogenase/sirohydrochlorin ferrochelatase family protein [Salibacterium aidingense]|uniref:precorrin-2 dehydrogenase/sirohydrochlorin ferrochelatase family protein n=1 Tax=Salibacterium aidingense TaxID=384933 RepID=UPI003BE50CF4
MFNFPLFLDLKDKPVVVIGGGKVACRKIKKLVLAYADIVVVAPKIHEDLKYLYDNGEIHWIKDVCRSDYLSTAFLIVSASGDQSAQHIIRDSVHPQQLVNGADDPDLGNVAFPAAFEEDQYHIAVSTKGHSPGAAKRMKQQLQDWIKRNKTQK